MSDIGNGTYKVAKLSDGREIRVDVEAMRRDIKTRHDQRSIANMDPNGEEYNAFLGKYSGLSTSEVDDLSLADFKALDRAAASAIGEIVSPN